MNTIDRFNAHWTPEPFSGCWLWTGCRNRKEGHGYGVLYISHTIRAALAHRVSWEIYRGIIPQGMCVLHHCDTPTCVNPDHLFIGTKRDNTRDCMAKDRFPERERHGRAKLTPEQIHEIRLSNASALVIAERYGVSRGHIYNIRANRTW